MSITKTRIDIELIDAVMGFRSYIQKLNLWEIDFYEDGVKLDIPKELVDEFGFTGLANIDFITTNYYRKETDLPPQ